jgi:hypothetical protein
MPKAQLSFRALPTKPNITAFAGATEMVRSLAGIGLDFCQFSMRPSTGQNYVEIGLA